VSVAGKDELIRSYAEALFRVADAEGELDAVERHLLAFARLLETEARVREALTDPALPIENKRALIEETLGERANPVAVRILVFLVELGRARGARSRCGSWSTRAWWAAWSPRSATRSSTGRSARG
jgi:F0F1-type ATP synthase delta subunit